MNCLYQANGIYSRRTRVLSCLITLQNISLITLGRHSNSHNFIVQMDKYFKRFCFLLINKVKFTILFSSCVCLILSIDYQLHKLLFINYLLIFDISIAEHDSRKTGCSTDSFVALSKVLYLLICNEWVRFIQLQGDAAACHAAQHA